MFDSALDVLIAIAFAVALGWSLGVIAYVVFGTPIGG